MFWNRKPAPVSETLELSPEALARYDRMAAKNDAIGPPYECPKCLSRRPHIPFDPPQYAQFTRWSGPRYRKDDQTLVFGCAVCGADYFAPAADTPRYEDRVEELFQAYTKSRAR